MDCFRFTCPFRVNESSSMNRCECVACPNRTTDHAVFATNSTNPDSKVKTFMYGQFPSDPDQPKLTVCYRDEGGVVVVVADRDGVTLCDGLAYFSDTDGREYKIPMTRLCSIIPCL